MKTTDQIDLLMHNQQRAIRWYFMFAVILLLLGLALFIGMLLSGQKLAAEPLKTVLGVAGGFISSISVFPLKEFNGCRDRKCLGGR